MVSGLQLGEELLARGSKELEKLRQKTRNWTGSLLPKLSHMIVLGEAQLQIAVFAETSQSAALIP